MSGWCGARVDEEDDTNYGGQAEVVTSQPSS